MPHSTTSGPRADVGLLLVHGIGEQISGRTIEQALDPILEVLTHFEGEGRCNVGVMNAEKDPESGPARVNVELSPTKATNSSCSWIIAESRWADSFNSPSLGRMIRWSWTYGRRVILRLFRGRMFRKRPIADPLKAHAISALLAGEDDDNSIQELANRLHQEWPHLQPEDLYEQLSQYRNDLEEYRQKLHTSTWFWWALQNPTTRLQIKAVWPMLTSGALFALPLLALPLTLLLLLPLAVALLPLLVVLSIIPGLPSPLQSMRSVFERTVGDAYVLTKNGFGRAAMLRAVEHDIDWLKERCDEVFILAHSQGSVIVEGVLTSTTLASDVRQTFVYGSAIGLLEDPSPKWADIDWTNFRALDDPINPLPLIPPIRLDRKGMNDDAAESKFREEFQHRDAVINNWDSAVRDHTTYWGNREQFVVPLMSRMLNSSTNNKPIVQDLRNWLGRLTKQASEANQRPRATRVARWTTIPIVLLLLVFKPTRDAMSDVAEAASSVSSWAFSWLPQPLLTAGRNVRSSIEGLLSSILRAVGIDAGFDGILSALALVAGTTLTLLLALSVVRWLASIYFRSQTERAWRRALRSARNAR